MQSWAGRHPARKWTDEQLRAALRESATITEVSRRLGKTQSGATTLLILAHAHRLGLGDVPLVVAARERQGRRARGRTPCTVLDCDRPALPRGYCLVHQRQLDEKGYVTPIRPWRHGHGVDLEVRLAASLLRIYRPELLVPDLRPPAVLRPALLVAGTAPRGGAA